MSSKNGIQYHPNINGTWHNDARASKCSKVFKGVCAIIGRGHDPYDPTAPAHQSWWREQSSLAVQGLKRKRVGSTSQRIISSCFKDDDKHGKTLVKPGKGHPANWVGGINLRHIDIHFSWRMRSWHLRNCASSVTILHGDIPSYWIVNGSYPLTVQWSSHRGLKATNQPLVHQEL